MGKRLTILLVAFAVTAAATIAALVVMKHGSLTELVPRPPPKHARFDDPTLAAVKGGGAGAAAGSTGRTAAAAATGTAGRGSAAAGSTGRTGSATLSAGRGSAAAGSAGAAGSGRTSPRGERRRVADARGAARSAGHRAGAEPHRAPAHLDGSGDLLVVCRPSCRVYIDGHAHGSSPPLKAIALPVGTHRLRVVGPGDHERRRAVVVAPNRVNKVTEVFGDGKATRSFRQETGTENW